MIIHRLMSLMCACFVIGSIGLLDPAFDRALADAENPADVQQSLTQLIDQLNKEDAESQRGTLDQIASYGNEACDKVADILVPVLSKCLESKDAPVRKKTLGLLESMGPFAQASIPGLVKVLNGIHDDDRYEAVDVLRSMGVAAAPAVPVLIETLDDKDQSTRDRAIEALGKIGPGAKDAVPALMAPLKEGWLTSNAEDALAAIGPDAAPALLDGLRDKLPSCRRLCIKGLAEMTDRPDTVVPAITKELRDNDFDVSRQACWALQSIGPAASSAVPALIDQLKSKNQYMRQFAADALGAIGPSAKDALPALKKSLTDEAVRRNARDAIKKIELGDKE